MNAVGNMAGVTTLGDLAGALVVRAEEASIVAELKAGSEEAYAWLIAHYHQPIYSLVCRILTNPADAADTTQEVFLKVYRGIRRFNGESSLKTWIYRIAVHEASNQRRWWFRHKAKELSMEPHTTSAEPGAPALKELLMDDGISPLEFVMSAQLRARVELELREVSEPYRTTLILRDVEELSYEEIADVMQTSLGTVKSRLMRGREQLRKRLAPILQEAGPKKIAFSGREVEVTS